MSSTAAQSSGVEIFPNANVCQSRFISFFEGVAGIDGAGNAQSNIVVAIERLFEATEFNAVVAVVPGASAIVAVDRVAMLMRC